jgi:hypothetical protein
MEKIDKYITLREASLISGYNSDYLSSLIRSGRIYGKKVGKNWLTTEADIRKYLQEAGETNRMFFAKLPRAVRMALLTVLVLFFAVLVIFGFYVAIYQHGYSEAQAQSKALLKPSTNLDLEPISY